VITIIASRHQWGDLCMVQMLRHAVESGLMPNWGGGSGRSLAMAGFITKAMEVW
jgi:hypothetical protein